MNKNPFSALALGTEFDPTAAGTGSYSNTFLPGSSYKFYESNLEDAPWGRTTTPIMLLDNGDISHARYVAECMVEGPGVVINGDHDNAKMKCLRTPSLAVKDGIPFQCMWDFVSADIDNGAFPEVICVETLPVARPVASIRTTEDGNADWNNLREFTGLSKEEILASGVEYVPAVLRAKTGSNPDSVFARTRTTFKIADAKRLPVIERGADGKAIEVAKVE